MNSCNLQSEKAKRLLNLIIIIPIDILLLVTKELFFSVNSIEPLALKEISKLSFN